MECVEAALKSNYMKEMTLKLSPQTLTEEVSVQNGTACDDFFVNDLLNLSHVEEEPEQQQQQQDTACVSLKQENPSHEPCTFKHDYASVPTSEHSVPADDVANLEWLSHFVEDSFSEEFSAPIPTLMENPTTGFKEAEPEPEILVFTFKTPVQTKARSKRTRNGVPVWSFGSPSSFTDSFSSSTTSSSSSSSPSSPLLIYTNNFPQSLDHLCSGPKPKKPFSSDNTTLAPPPPRRCSHCGVQKTPQWRNGPLGPKTLCNACGVRFKSGRLLPEYRPACSPTFSHELHSNHHRKVLEMRRKKEIVSVDETGFAPAHVVPSF